MNRSDIYLNDFGTDFRPSSARPIDFPILSLSTGLSLLGYLLTLALTQTAYGYPFMTARWLMLGAFVASSTADMILVSTRGGFRARMNNGQILFTYLFATLSTVIYAENWMFSGMRWASHALMLLALMIILPQIITLRQIQMLLVILKYLMAALVVSSWLFPAPEVIVGNGALYHGVMGNANTMGHIAFITALLFLQSFLTSKVPWIRNVSGALALAAMITIWRSGARSSMIAFAIAVLLLSYYYRREMRGLVLVGILLGSLAMITFPKLTGEVTAFTQKSERIGKSKSLVPVQSRIPVWSAAFEGFKKRPLLGWGFGADCNISKQWEVKLTALGTVERDAVNDFLFMLEGCGIVGLTAYLLLIGLVLKQRPSRYQRSLLRDSSGFEARSNEMALHHTHIAFFVLSACLLVLNQFDNTALSAGNLISVILWLSAGCAAVIRSEMG